MADVSHSKCCAMPLTCFCEGPGSSTGPSTAAELGLSLGSSLAADVSCFFSQAVMPCCDLPVLLALAVLACC